MYQRLRFLSCIASVGLLLAGCGEAEKKSIAERETRVTLQPLEKRVFRHQIPVQGTVYPVEYAVLSAKISGTLELLKVDEGDVRKKGDVLFGIDRQILKNQVTVREDEIKVKQAELESAKLALQSAKILEERRHSTTNGSSRCGARKRPARANLKPTKRTIKRPKPTSIPPRPRS